MKWLWTCSLLMWLGACSSEPPFDDERVALLLAEAECACTQDASCVANEVRSLRRFIDNGVERGSFALETSTLAACEDQIASCQASTPACDALLTGFTPPEGSCTHSAECEGDAFCRLSPGVTTSPYCPGLGKCVPRVARDEACTHSLACSGGLTCVASQEAGIGVCTDPVREGGVCFFESAARESVYALCAGTGQLVCAASGTCQRVAATTPPRGGRCNYDYECAAEDYCEGGHCDARQKQGGPCQRRRHCQHDMTCKQGACQPASALGRGCDPSRGNADCLSPWVCDGEGVCRDPVGLCFGPGSAPPPSPLPDAGTAGAPRTALGSACTPGEALGEDDPELFCANEGPLQGVVTRRCSPAAPDPCQELDGSGASCVTPGVCARTCASDSECAFGLHCDAQLAVCTR